VERGSEHSLTVSSTQLTRPKRLDLLYFSSLLPVVVMGLWGRDTDGAPCPEGVRQARKEVGKRDQTVGYGREGSRDRELN
jgi:hypothetical protein